MTPADHAAPCAVDHSCSVRTLRTPHKIYVANSTGRQNGMRWQASPTAHHRQCTQWMTRSESVLQGCASWPDSQVGHYSRFVGRASLGCMHVGSRGGDGRDGGPPCARLQRADGGR
eukprot:359463-Chlamydomonas_euryale.AAC.2